jgi:DNA-directed DNA polymerase III PolC|tara:strand:+ start:38136 stop:40700 length:2565 start_codon:yes stop_codon:yes gene_type:complete
MNALSKIKKINLPLHGVRLPSFKVSNEQKRSLKLSENLNNEEFVKSVCIKALKDKNVYNEKYIERFKYEFSTLKDLGFIDYILLVWDVINYCNQEMIPTGLGRGSAAGSLILYLMGVTKIDPVENDLFFERFVSKIRAKKKEVDGVIYLDGALMCDVDLDICYYNRQRVLRYLAEKFSGKTSKILTFNTLSAKLLIKECGKIAGAKTETEMNTVSAMIPKVFGQVKDIREAREEVEDFRDWCEENEEVYDIALKLRGLVKNKGVHPSAVIISYDPLEESCPLELTSDKKSSVVSFDMNWASISNVKLDILGLRAVSVVDDVCKKVGIKATDIDLAHESIYQNLYDLRSPHGLFQIEAETNFKVCRKVKPKNLDELSAVLALARPGALAFVDQYANYTNNDVYEAIHPFFDDILTSTGGVALYQEQLMKMAHKIGFTLDEAEILRRIVGKKKVSEVRKWKKKIKDKITENGLSEDVGDVLWKILEDSANYSFNKSHSISYAALAAITVYLKFNHPQQFFLSLLKMTRHEPDPINEISKIHKEMDIFEIKLLPPHLTKSKMDFSAEGKDIRFGLLSIKGISDKSIEKLASFKQEYESKFEIFEAAKQAGLNIGSLCALIQAGALEGDFKQSRTKVVYESQLWNILTSKEKTLCQRLGGKFNYNLVDIIKYLKDNLDEKGKPFIKDSRVETIRKKSAPYAKIFHINKVSESFANWYYEKFLLGYTYNKSLKNIFDKDHSGLISVRTACEVPLRHKVKFVGSLEEDPYSGVSRSAKKSRYMRMQVSDDSGSIKVMIFNEKMDSFKSKYRAKANDIILVQGTKFEDVIFADDIVVKSEKVFTKLSQIRGSEDVEEILDI